MSPSDFHHVLLQGVPRVFRVRNLRGVCGLTAGEEKNGAQHQGSDGHVYTTHSGYLGVVPLLLMARSPVNCFGEGSFSNGTMINCPDDIVVVSQNGVLTVAMGSDRRVVVDTRSSSSVDDDDENDGGGSGGAEEDVVFEEEEEQVAEEDTIDIEGGDDEEKQKKPTSCRHHHQPTSSSSSDGVMPSKRTKLS
jgi:hypothetical protein